VSDLALRLLSLGGLVAIAGLAWLCSSDRRGVPWRVIAWGTGLQLGLGALLLRTEAGRGFFVGVNGAVDGLVRFTDAGTRFMFGPLKELGFSFVIEVIPIIIFMGALFGVLYHLGTVQWLVGLLARALARSMGLSGAESLAAVANIFVGMTEAPLMVRPYLERMTRSELFCVMTTGMATIAGSVLVAYAKMLGEQEYAGHLVTASLLSAPAGVMIAKLMVPESGAPVTGVAAGALVERSCINVIDAASEGALAALRLAAYVAALLIAFVALIAMVNAGVGALGGLAGVEGLTLERIFGFVFAPLALLMGVAPADALEVGSLLGVKTVLNEFLAYQDLAGQIAAGSISHRSAVIASYGLCGFANLGSLAILIGGMGGMAPSRRSEIAALGLRSIAAGTFASAMTGCVAGLLL
jgi:CNT family concentrative nucleoside transporter